jgi:SAM-dependent methyltransferase
MAGDDELDPQLAAAYAVDGPDASRKLYADWAGTYDEGFVDRLGYEAHDRVAETFVAGHQAGQDPVLDVGCGTGNVGLALRRLGVAVVDGIDLSPEMLAQAGAKRIGAEPVYRQLMEADLSGPISVPSASYAGIVSAGTFTHGHLGPDALDELLRVARPGARAAIGVNAAHFHERGFASWFEAAHAAGRISEPEMVDAATYREVEGTVPEDLNRLARIVVFLVS